HLLPCSLILTLIVSLVSFLSYFFFFNHPATPFLYSLSLHDALPIFTFTFQFVMHNAEQNEYERIRRPMRLDSGLFLQSPIILPRRTWKLRPAALYCTWGWTNRLHWLPVPR